jgi:hypothetical protein
MIDLEFILIITIVDPCVHMLNMELDLQSLFGLHVT